MLSNHCYQPSVDTTTASQGQFGQSSQSCKVLQLLGIKFWLPAYVCLLCSFAPVHCTRLCISVKLAMLARHACQSQARCIAAHHDPMAAHPRHTPHRAALSIPSALFYPLFKLQ